MGVDDVERPIESSTAKKSWTNDRHMLLTSSTKFGVQGEGAAMIMNAVNAVVGALASALAGEDVDLVPAAFQAGGQLGHVDADAADRDGMKRFPGKQGNSHSPSSSAGTLIRAGKN